jgi:ribosomal protein S27E
VPCWALRCPECKRDFTYSHAAARSNQGRYDYFLSFEPKPEFPAGGLQIECPNCKQTSLFRSHDLVYIR